MELSSGSSNVCYPSQASYDLDMDSNHTPLFSFPRIICYNDQIRTTRNIWLWVNTKAGSDTACRENRSRVRKRTESNDNESFSVFKASSSSQKQDHDKRAIKEGTNEELALEEEHIRDYVTRVIRVAQMRFTSSLPRYKSHFSFEETEHVGITTKIREEKVTNLQDLNCDHQVDSWDSAQSRVQEDKVTSILLPAGSRETESSHGSEKQLTTSRNKSQLLTKESSQEEPPAETFRNVSKRYARQAVQSTALEMPFINIPVKAQPSTPLIYVSFQAENGGSVEMSLQVGDSPVEGSLQVTVDLGSYDSIAEAPSIPSVSSPSPDSMFHAGRKSSLLKPPPNLELMKPESPHLSPSDQSRRGSDSALISSCMESPGLYLESVTTISKKSQNEYNPGIAKQIDEDFQTACQNRPLSSLQCHSMQVSKSCTPFMRSQLIPIPKTYLISRPASTWTQNKLSHFDGDNSTSWEDDSRRSNGKDNDNSYRFTASSPMFKTPGSPNILADGSELTASRWQKYFILTPESSHFDRIETVRSGHDMELSHSNISLSPMECSFFRKLELSHEYSNPALADCNSPFKTSSIVEGIFSETSAEPDKLNLSAVTVKPEAVIVIVPQDEKTGTPVQDLEMPLPPTPRPSLKRRNPSSESLTVHGPSTKGCLSRRLAESTQAGSKRHPISGLSAAKFATSTSSPYKELTSLGGGFKESPLFEMTAAHPASPAPSSGTELSSQRSSLTAQLTQPCSTVASWPSDAPRHERDPWVRDAGQDVQTMVVPLREITFLKSPCLSGDVCEKDEPSHTDQVSFSDSVGDKNASWLQISKAGQNLEHSQAAEDAPPTEELEPRLVVTLRHVELDNKHTLEQGKNHGRETEKNKDPGKTEKDKHHEEIKKRDFDSKEIKESYVDSKEMAESFVDSKEMAGKDVDSKEMAERDIDYKEMTERDVDYKEKKGKNNNYKEVKEVSDPETETIGGEGHMTASEDGSRDPNCLRKIEHGTSKTPSKSAFVSSAVEYFSKMFRFRSTSIQTSDRPHRTMVSLAGSTITRLDTPSDKTSDNGRRMSSTAIANFPGGSVKENGERGVSLQPGVSYDVYHQRNSVASEALSNIKTDPLEACWEKLDPGFSALNRAEHKQHQSNTSVVENAENNTGAITAVDSPCTLPQKDLQGPGTRVSSPSSVVKCSQNNGKCSGKFAVVSNIKKLQNCSAAKNSCQRSSREDRLSRDGMTPGILSGMEDQPVPTQIVQQVLQQLPSRSNKSTAAPPLYIVHPITGSVEMLQELTRGLDVCCFGIRKTEQTPDNSVESMARFYCQVVKQNNKCQSFHLAGYSYGGLVVFEMARQLQHEGKRVEILLMLDGSPDYIRSQIHFTRCRLPRMAISEQITAIMEAHALLHFISLYRPVYQREEVQTMLVNADSHEKRVQIAINLTMENSCSESEDPWLDNTKEDLSSCRTTKDVINLKRQHEAFQFLQAINIADKFDADKGEQFHGDIHLIRTKSLPEYSSLRSADYGLGRLCTGDVWVHYVDGGHETMMQPPYVQSVCSTAQAIVESCSI